MTASPTSNAATTTKPKGQRKVVRTIFMFGVWLILAGIVLQVLLIGLGLFYDSKFLGAHAGLGWPLGHLAPLFLILGFFGRLGRNLVVVNIVNLVCFLALPFLAGARQDAPLAAAFHPLTALTVFTLTLYTAVKVRTLVPTPWGSAAPTATPTVPTA